MDGVSTLDLGGTIDAMTPLFQSGPPQQSGSQAPLVYNPEIIPPATSAPKKNIPPIQMDSTPLSDIMGGAPMGGPIGGGMGMDMGSPMMMAAEPQYMQAPQQSKRSSSSGGFMNLTPEQTDALLAGIVGVIAFSNPVQEKLLQFLPQMLSEGGDRTTIGLLVTALVAAILFYFGKRFVAK
jgi:hypothetical protein